MSHRSALDLARDLIRLPSVNPPGDEGACAALVASLLEAGGLRVSQHSFAPGRVSVVAALEGSGDGRPICFTGHLDTVPLGAAPWSHDPFAAEIDGDRLYGRGSTDMKAGVAAMVVAALELAKRPRGKSGLLLVLTAGEETGCDGARFLVGLPGVIPKAGALVVGEPTGNVPRIGHKGALWLRAVFHGVTAHGSMPEQGDNAVYKAARGVLRLAEHRFDPAHRHRHLGQPTLNVGSLHGGLNVNSVPDRAEAAIDIRTVPGQSNESITADIAALLESADVSPMVDVDAVATDPQNEWISDVFDLFRDADGRSPDPRGAPFFTDASVLTSALGNVPTVILGPGETAMAHKTDEYCLIPKIEASVALYSEIARRWVAA